MNPYLKRGSTIGDSGRKSESRVSKKYRGSLVPASGAGTKKGDFHLGDLQVECKSTQADSMKVEFSWLRKLRREALSAGMTPALLMSFTDSEGNSKEGGEWLVVPSWVLEKLLEK